MRFVGAKMCDEQGGFNSYSQTAIVVYCAEFLLFVFCLLMQDSDVYILLQKITAERLLLHFCCLFSASTGPLGLCWALALVCLWAAFGLNMWSCLPTTVCAAAGRWSLETASPSWLDVSHTHLAGQVRATPSHQLHCRRDKGRVKFPACCS